MFVVYSLHDIPLLKTDIEEEAEYAAWYSYGYYKWEKEEEENGK